VAAGLANIYALGVHSLLSAAIGALARNGGKSAGSNAGADVAGGSPWR
jgi:hypothetical protein